LYKTVTASLCGGLGNQLFQYAAARALAAQHKANLILDLSWFEKVHYLRGVTVRSYALEPFSLPVQLKKNKPVLKWFSRLAFFLEKVIFSLKLPLIHGLYIEKSFNFDPNFYKLEAPVRLSGYWQSFKYFESIASLIRSEIGTPRHLSMASAKVLDKIRSTDAICIHVRRGDYISNQSASDYHGLCSMDYYQRGVELVLEGLISPQGFVFTDDPDWAKECLQLPIPFMVVDVNGPEAAHEDLWLMSACRRFIIANSSLSWWGAWLSAATDKIVVAPQRWFSDEEIDTQDLILPEWIRI